MSVLGNNTIGNTDDTATADNKECYQVTAVQDGFITKLTGYISGVGPGSGNQKIKAIIYADNGSNLPGALLGVSAEVTVIDPTAYGWVDFTFSPNVNIVNGQKYWFGYIAGAATSGDTIQLKAFAGAGIRYHFDTYADGPSDPFGTADPASKASYSLYATYTPSVKTLGNTGIGGIDDTATADDKEAYKVTPIENGTITKMTGYISGNGPGVGAQKLRTIVYADSAGVPGIFLGMSDEVTIPDAVGYSWVDFNFSSGVSFSNGVPIWIGYIGGAPSDGSQLKAFSGSGLVFNSDTYADLPNQNTFGPASVSGTKSGYSLYATYTPSSFTPPSTGLPFKGLATGYWLNQPDSQIQRTINEAKAAGCQIMRWDVNPAIWARTQAVANMVLAANMPCYLVYNAQHDATNIHNWLNLMVPWFRDRGQHIWEFINEPNAYWGGWDGSHTVGALPADYVTALKIFTPYIKGIDPNAYVVCGAISGASQSPPAQYAPDVWFQGLLDAGLAAADFDAVSVHPYNDVALATAGNTWRQTWGTTPSIRQKMDAKGAPWTSKPIWASECGGAPGYTIPGTVTIIQNVYTFFSRTDMGPLGAALVYSPEQSDGYSVLWPGGVPNALATTYAGIAVPTGGSTFLANADLQPVFNVAALKRTDLIVNYNVAPLSPATFKVNADLVPSYNLKAHASSSVAIIYSVQVIAAPPPVLPPIEPQVVAPEPLPTDLEPFSLRLDDLIEPVLGGER